MTNLDPASIEGGALLDVLRCAERLGTGVLGKTTSVRQAGESGRQSSQKRDDGGGVHLVELLFLIETSDVMSDGVIPGHPATPAVYIPSTCPSSPPQSCHAQAVACHQTYTANNKNIGIANCPG